MNIGVKTCSMQLVVRSSLWVVILLITTIVQAQYLENFFMDGFGTHRENHSFLNANNVGKIYELREDMSTGEKVLIVTQFDHNGLPVSQKFFEASDEQAWEPNGQPFEQVDYLYIMENLFLKREKRRVKMRGENRDTVSLDVDYINFFQRKEKSLEDGTSLKYEYINDNQLKSFVTIFPDSGVHKLEVNYLYGRVKEANELKKLPGGTMHTVRSAEYAYNELNRPMEVNIVEGESIRQALIEYDSLGLPSIITWKKNGEPTTVSHYRMEERKPLIPELMKD